MAAKAAARSKKPAAHREADTEGVAAPMLPELDFSHLAEAKPERRSAPRRTAVRAATLRTRAKRR